MGMREEGAFSIKPLNRLYVFQTPHNRLPQTTALRGLSVKNTKIKATGHWGLQ